MTDLSDGPGLVARKRGDLDSFVLTARLSDSLDQYGFLRVVTCLRAIKEENLTSAEMKVAYLCFAKVLYEERNGFKRFGAANGGT